MDEIGSQRVKPAQMQGWAAVRVGSWNNDHRNARSANRNRNVPDNFNDNAGFRVFSHDLRFLPTKAVLNGGGRGSLLEPALLIPG